MTKKECTFNHGWNLVRCDGTPPPRFVLERDLDWNTAHTKSAALRAKGEDVCIVSNGPCPEGQRGIDAYVNDEVIDFDAQSDCFQEAYRDAWFTQEIGSAGNYGDNVEMRWDEKATNLHWDYKAKQATSKPLTCCICSNAVAELTLVDGRLLCGACEVVFSPIHATGGRAGEVIGI